MIKMYQEARINGSCKMFLMIYMEEGALYTTFTRSFRELCPALAKLYEALCSISKSFSHHLSLLDQSEE